MWGRFINADGSEVIEILKIDLLQINIYAYCSNNPVNCTDSYGFGRIDARWIAFIVDSYSKFAFIFAGAMAIAGFIVTGKLKPAARKGAAVVIFTIVFQGMISVVSIIVDYKSIFKGEGSIGERVALILDRRDGKQDGWIEYKGMDKSQNISDPGDQPWKVQY